MSEREFTASRAADGGAVYFIDTYGPGTFDNSIIAFGEAGSAVSCEIAGSLPVLTCCDLYGNQGGDPLFCDPVNGDFQLDCSSPCNEGYGCGRIGAYGVGCAASALVPTTWSTIKWLYR